MGPNHTETQERMDFEIRVKRQVPGINTNFPSSLRQKAVFIK